MERLDIDLFDSGILYMVANFWLLLMVIFIIVDLFILPAMGILFAAIGAGITALVLYFFG